MTDGHDGGGGGDESEEDVSQSTFAQNKLRLLVYRGVISIDITLCVFAKRVYCITTIRRRSRKWLNRKTATPRDV